MTTEHRIHIPEHLAEEFTRHLARHHRIDRATGEVRFGNLTISGLVVEALPEVRVVDAARYRRSEIRWTGPPETWLFGARDQVPR